MPARFIFATATSLMPSAILRYGDDSVTNTALAPITSREAIVRRGQVLEYLTLGSYGLEAVVSIAAGLMA